MSEWLRRKVLGILRVPPEPEVPEGSPGSALTFRAGRNFYRWLVLLWTLSHVGVVVGAIFTYYFAWRMVVHSPPWLQYVIEAAEAAGLIGVALVMPLSFVALRWNYELRWYIVTDRSLRIRRGVWSIEELTLTFANIQEIRVTAGPIQKVLGIADVEVHAAGGGTGPDGTQSDHAARFEGVDNAEAIRDLIVDRLRIYRDLGLGGGGEVRESGSATLAGLQAVLAEAKGLRTALQEESR